MNSVSCLGDIDDGTLAPFALAWEVPISAVTADGQGPIGRSYVDAATGAVLHYENDKHECNMPGCAHPHHATANNDYQDNDGTLTFAGTMGEAFNITVLVNGDLVVEANEGFNVVLGAITGAPAGVTVVGSTQMGLILNDEIDFGDAPDSYGTLLTRRRAPRDLPDCPSGRNV